MDVSEMDRINTLIYEQYKAVKNIVDHHEQIGQTVGNDYVACKAILTLYEVAFGRTIDDAKEDEADIAAALKAQQEQGSVPLEELAEKVGVDFDKLPPVPVGDEPPVVGDVPPAPAPDAPSPDSTPVTGEGAATAPETAPGGPATGVDPTPGKDVTIKAPTAKGGGKGR